MSPEGILMLCVAGLLDVASTVCAILIAVFGLGALLNYVVEGIALVVMGAWMFLRYSAMGSEGGMKTKEKNEEDEEDEKTQEQPNIEMPQKDTTENPYNKSPGAKNTNLPVGNQKAGNIKNPKNMAKNEAKELGKKALKRFGFNFLIETIPFVGAFYPANVIIVYKEMKE